MNFEFTTEQELLRKAAREFVEQEIAPLVEEMEQTDKMPPELIKKMADQGYYGVTIPQAYGGSNLGHVARLIILEEVGRVSAAVSMSLQTFQFGGGCVADLGSETQKQKYIPDFTRGKSICASAVTEATGGSNPSATSTEAIDQGDYFLLNGRKVFITNSNISNVAIVLAKTKDEPKKEFSIFIVDKNTGGFRAGRTENKIGFRGCATGELIFENCKVPKNNLLGKPGQGLVVMLKELSKYGRVGIVGVALGIMQASYEAALKFARERVMYGRPISNLPSIHFRIAEIYADLEASKLLAYKAAWLLDQAKHADVEIATAKFFVTEAALRCTRKAMDIHGGYGCVKEYAVERYCRDAQLLIPADGTNDIQRVVVGRGLTASKK